MPRIIDYLQSAVSDNTAHSQMDRLLLENEMDNDPLSGLAQQPQHSMSVPRRLHPEDALPIGKGAKIIGNMIGGKYIPNRVLKKRIAESKLVDSYEKEIKEIKKFIDSKGFMGYSTHDEMTKAKRKMKELRDLYIELRPSMKGRNFQEGGSIERTPLLAYMNPSMQDETAHSQMDRLMFENELEQQPQHSMGVTPEPYDPAREFAEGMMPVGGALKLLKGSKHWPSFQKNLSKVAAHEKKVHEVLQQTSQTPLGKLMDKGGSDKATKDYLTTLWIQRNLK